MIFDITEKTCRFWSSDQYYDPTYQIWRNCDSKWTGDWKGRLQWFTWDSAYVIDLESSSCVETWSSSKLLLSGSQYSTGKVCRETNFYVDPSSSEVIELGTKVLPYKTMRAVFSEILNNLSHTKSSITIYLKENTNVFVNDEANYMVNMTSVKILSYSNNSSFPGKAFLIPTQITLPTTHDRTLFHILNNLDLDLNKAMKGGSLTDYEIGLVTTTKSTFSVTRCNLYMDNLVIIRQPEDNMIRWFFVFFVYLQDRVFDIRNTDFNLTGLAFRSYDPLSIYMENLYLKFFNQSIFVNFYPEMKRNFATNIFYEKDFPSIKLS